MPIQLEVKRKLCTRTDRVKCVQFHPSEPWVLSSLYSGCAQLYNYETQANVKTFEVANVPLRSGIFVVRKSWVIFGSDDMFVRVFNYNTMEKVKEFEAHSDYLRSIVAHPSQPLLLTSSDDMTIKMWDWEDKWALKQTFEGHIHYVMQIELNPKDPNTFASGSMDRTIKVWHLGSGQANYTLDGHQRGVNCVSYYSGSCNADKPYLLSGGDDNVVKVWDYQNKSCIHTINAHYQNVNFVACHPSLPLIVSGSEDGTVRYWNASTYRMESMLNYGLERCWTGCVNPAGNEVAIGYDLGTVVVQMGTERPAASMDQDGSKVVWAMHNVIQYATVSGVGLSMPDGARLPLSVKELGSCEVFPTSLSHSPNGRFIAVCGNGEYIIYTALALRSKAYGSAQDFVWSSDPGYFATRQGSEVKVHRNFKDVTSVAVDRSPIALFGGRLLGVQSRDGIAFYDWSLPGTVVCRVEVVARTVIWSDDGQRVAIGSAEDNCFFLIDVAPIDDISAEDEQEVMQISDEVAESITSGIWYNSFVFIYTTSANKLSYRIGSNSMAIARLDKSAFILGYSAADDRVILIDKELSITFRQLFRSVLDYQCLIVQNRLADAELLGRDVPADFRTRLAHFLEQRGLYAQAIDMTTDLSHKFEIAKATEDIATLTALAEQLNSEHKWKQLSKIAIRTLDLEAFERSLTKASDLPGLLMLAKATGNRKLMNWVAEMAMRRNQFNTAFLAYFTLADANGCYKVLLESRRLAEAVRFAYVYLPSKLEEAIGQWKSACNSKRIAKLIPLPSSYPNLFPHLPELLKLEAIRDSRLAGEAGTEADTSGGAREAIEQPVEDLPDELFDEDQTSDDGNDGDFISLKSAETESREDIANIGLSD